jgi:hypothetical protein
MSVSIDPDQSMAYAKLSPPARALADAYASAYEKDHGSPVAAVLRVLADCIVPDGLSEDIRGGLPEAPERYWRAQERHFARIDILALAEELENWR